MQKKAVIVLAVGTRTFTVETPFVNKIGTYTAMVDFGPSGGRQAVRHANREQAIKNAVEIGTRFTQFMIDREAK